VESLYNRELIPLVEAIYAMFGIISHSEIEVFFIVNYSVQIAMFCLPLCIIVPKIMAAHSLLMEFINDQASLLNG
jgi:hypothetical protein